MKTGTPRARDRHSPGGRTTIRRTSVCSASASHERWRVFPAKSRSSDLRQDWTFPRKRAGIASPVVASCDAWQRADVEPDHFRANRCPWLRREWPPLGGDPNVTTGRSPEGRRQRQRVSGQSKAAVHDALKELRKEFDGGITKAAFMRAGCTATLDASARTPAGQQPADAVRPNNGN